MVIATLVDGVANMNLGDSEVLTMFLVVVACGYLALEKDVAREAPKTPEELSVAASTNAIAERFSRSIRRAITLYAAPAPGEV